MRYCTNDAAGAEVAMLEWEKHVREGQRARITRVDFDLDYAQTYSRLYLVEKHLGKNDAAEAYFQESLPWWHKVNAKERRPKQSVEEILNRIENELAQQFPIAWRTNR